MADLAQFTAQNKFLMLALDHRTSIRKHFQTDEQTIQFKQQIIEALDDLFSGLLIDVTYGLSAYKNKLKPYLLPSEKSGYVEIDGERVSKLEKTALELKKLGAKGIKLLLYFNPDAESAKEQLATAKQVADECEKEDLPFFLEIVTYDSLQKKKDVLSAVKYFLEGNVFPDVFKLEYPGDGDSCKDVTNMLGKTPWILLTGGGEFEEFKLQLQSAMANGCSGFLAGRSLWKEYLDLKGNDADYFLKETLRMRFKEISQIANQS